MIFAADDLTDELTVGPSSCLVTHGQLAHHTGLASIADLAVQLALTVHDGDHVADPALLVEDALCPPSPIPLDPIRGGVVYVTKITHITPRITHAEVIRMITSGRPVSATRKAVQS